MHCAMGDDGGSDSGTVTYLCQLMLVSYNGPLLARYWASNVALKLCCAGCYTILVGCQ